MALKENGMATTRKTPKKPRRTRQRHTLASSAKKTAASAKTTKRWSHHVMETSDAMDLQSDIFKSGSAQEIADSLKRSSERSKRRKGTPFQSAMSMLNFYINRAGRNLPKTRRTTLDVAKKRLREAFGRKP
jgi:Protein of unknown function (DUF3175)